MAKPVLRKGMSPKNSTSEQVEAIKFLQRFLGVNPDGDFGPKTDTAVRDYQKLHNLKVDGVVGENTWKTIPTNPIAQKPTVQQKAIATTNAATTAATKIKEQAVAAAKPAVPRPTPAAKNPVQAAANVAAETAKKAQAAVTTTAKKAAGTVKQTHVLIKKQPLWLQIVTFAAAGLGAIAGYKALTDKPRRAA